MIKLGKPRKHICAGIDIGSYSIKVLESVSDHSEKKLTKFACKRIPPDISEDSLTATLKEVIEKAGLSTKDVCISLSGPNAIVRFIDMPEMAPADLNNSLKYEADKYIPFGIDEVNIDSFILSDEKDGKGQMKVLLAAAKKELINQRLDLFRHLGFDVSLIDVDAFSAFNAFLAAEGTVENESNIAILNIGHRYTNIIIAKGATPFFTRDIQIGGQQVIKAVSAQISIPEDEIIKSDSPHADKIKEAVREGLSRLGEEIKLSFGYYENQTGHSVDKIYVSGGLAGLKGLSEYFEENIGVAPVVWDCLKGFSIEPGIDQGLLEKMRSSLAVTCGLLVRSEN